MKPSSESFPSILQAAFLVLANFLLNYFAIVVLCDFRQSLDLSLFQIDALARLLGNGLLLASIAHYSKISYRDLLHPSPSSALATAALLVLPILLLVPLLLLANTGLSTLLETLWPLSKWEERAFQLMADDSLAAFLSVCVLAPVLEEMLFRGILLRSFLQRYPRGFAIAASALLFGAAHLNIYQFVLAFLLGLLLGWLYERSRSLIPCVVLHAAMNTGATLITQSVPTGTEFQLSDISLWAWGLSTTAAILATLFLMRCLNAKPVQTN